MDTKVVLIFVFRRSVILFKRQASGYPLWNLLVMLEPQSLQFQSSENIVQPKLTFPNGGQARARFELKSFSQNLVISFQIPGIPPSQDTILRGLDGNVARQFLAFLFLIHGTMGWKKIPEVIAWPSSPRKAANVEGIAKREGCSVRKVNMTISLAFLAPDLVEAAIEGRLPRGMGVARLCDLPAEWSRQHQMLGFTPQ